MNLVLLDKYLTSEAYDVRLTERLLNQQEAEDNYFKRLEFMAKLSDDPILFTETYGWVFEPRLTNNPDLEFFMFPYQKAAMTDLYEAEVKGEDRLYEKSRDMGFTWIVSYYFLWRLLFTKGWIGLYGSRKQEETDNRTINSFFGKVRYGFYKLPAYLIPQGFKKKMHDNENKMVNPELNSMIQGESSNTNFSRDRRSSICVIDELFLQEYAQDMWRNSAETAKCRIGVSTPKPTRFAQILKEAMTTNGWLRSFHWSQHPFKDKDWYEQVKKRYEGDEMGLKTELELEYKLDASIVVYPQAEGLRIGHFDYDPHKPLYVSMDWGVAPSQTVFCWWQNQNGKWILLESLKAMDKPLTPESWYSPFLNPSIEVNPRFKYTGKENDVLSEVRKWHKPNFYFGEAAHTMKAQTSSTSISQELSKDGINLRYNPNAVGHDKRQAATKQLFSIGVEINDTYYNRSVLDDLRMSRFPATKGTNEKVAPVHDEASDARSAVENFSVNILSGILKIKDFTYRKY